MIFLIIGLLCGMLFGILSGWATYYFPLDLFYKIRWIFAKHVHTELYYDDKTWEQIKKHCKTKKTTWYVVTPANYEYMQLMFGMEFTKEELSKILAKRVHWLVKNGQKVGLHIHFQHTRDTAYSKLHSLFKESLEWAKKNDIKFTEGFVSGWWTESDDIKEACKKYGLRFVPRTRFYMHDFELRGE